MNGPLMLYVIEEALRGGDWEPTASQRLELDPDTAHTRRASLQAVADQLKTGIAYRVQAYVRRDGAVSDPRAREWLPLTR